LASNGLTAGSGTATGGADGSDLYNLSFGAGSPSASVILKNSILATAPAGARNLVNNQNAGTATVTASAPNLVMASAQLGGTMTGTPLTMDPMLATLADNGGPTQTLLLNQGSPAFDTGDPAICAASPVSGVDARGQPRCGCDLGAFQTLFVRCADLAVTVSEMSMDPGTPGLFEVTVTNNGPADVQSAALTTHLEVAGGPSPSGVSWTCTAMGPNGASTVAACSLASGSDDINMTLTLPSGGTATLQVTILPAADSDITVRYTAQVDAPTLIIDAAQGNNTAEATLAVYAPVVPLPDNLNVPPDGSQGSGCRTTGSGGSLDLTWGLLLLLGLFSLNTQGSLKRTAKK
jgi:hypothetical protein